MSTPHNKHDAFFRSFFGRPDALRDLLTTYLPSDTLAVLDMEHLTTEPDTYIDDGYRRMA